MGKAMFRFTIQAAKHKDAKAVCRICGEVLTSEISPEITGAMFTKIIEDIEQIVMVAFISGHVAGFIHARIVRDLVLGQYVEIVNIAMAEYYQRKGGGTSLVQGVEQWCCQMQNHKTMCFLKSENEAMRSLLTRCGYLENSVGAFEKYIV